MFRVGAFRGAVPLGTGSAIVVSHRALRREVVPPVAFQTPRRLSYTLLRVHLMAYEKAVPERIICRRKV